jgi:Na+/H+ antiporter NhaD/arsenite permease-like protein
MTLIIVLLLIFGCCLIATGHLTGVNKAAVAIFMGTVGWVVYISWGSDYVMQQHPREYVDFLSGQAPSSEAVKYFICENVFLKYVGRAASIVMFLLSTMTIIEILNTNGCFDFITEWIRTRNSKRLLWTITLATFILSANLDNLTTVTMMLVVMHSIVRSRAQRMLVGSAIVLAANCGGCFTVIGDPIGLLLWGDGTVSATNFSMYLFLPALVAWVVPTILINRHLPDRLDIEWQSAPYRGDDTKLNRWQRLVMLFVGIGGLWFIPTFHNITKLSPFLGALCVLSVLWVVNEAFNRKLNASDQMAQRRIPRALQYGSIQQMLFVMGIMLGIGVAVETGVLGEMAEWLDKNVHNVWLVAAVSGLLSSVTDTFTIALTGVSLYSVADAGSLQLVTDSDYLAQFAQNGIYWKLTAYATAVGGSLLTIGSTSGLALMKMEHLRLGWYFRKVMPMVFCGFVLGFAILYLETLLLQ